MSQAAGELISVRSGSIFLLDAQGKDGTYDVAEITKVRVVRKSKAKTGGIIGFVVGGLVFGVIGAKAPFSGFRSTGGKSGGKVWESNPPGTSKGPYMVEFIRVDKISFN